MAELIIVILYGPGACPARKAASTLVRVFFRCTVAVAATKSRLVSASGGISPPSPRCHSTGCSAAAGMVPPTDSSSPAIQLSRRTSPSVNTPMPASRWSAIASSAARSSAARNCSSVSGAIAVARPRFQQVGGPQQAAYVLGVHGRARRHGR